VRNTAAILGFPILGPTAALSDERVDEAHDLVS